MPELLNPGQAAEFLGVTRKTIYNWIDDPRVEIPYKLVGPYKRKAFDQEELAAWFGNGTKLYKEGE